MKSKSKEKERTVLGVQYYIIPVVILVSGLSGKTETRYQKQIVTWGACTVGGSWDAQPDRAEPRSSKLLIRAFLVGSGLARGVTLLRLINGVGPFLQSCKK